MCVLYKYKKEKIFKKLINLRKDEVSLKERKFMKYFV